MSTLEQRKIKTEQENFWAGDFGNEYISRNDDQSLITANTFVFAKILAKISGGGGVNSVIEFGSNIGNNIFAMKHLLPNCTFSSIEINEKAANILKERYASKYNEEIQIYTQSILDFNVDYQRDLSLIKGVLIHINPDELQNVYQKLYNASKKYILVMEYYNTTPIEVSYRGNTEKLFKRDFAGELLDKFSDLNLVDYGFVYHRDKDYPMDDITWFLLEK